MQYRTDPKTGNRLSALGYGCMRLSRRGVTIDQEKADRELGMARELGVNYYDTAYIYPGSEAALGSFLQRQGGRDSVYIATKLPQFLVKGPEDPERYFQEELERLRTDRIDYYLLHMLNDVHSWQRLRELGVEDWLVRKKREGRIGSICFSFHGGTRQFQELVDAFDWDMCQIQLNYMDETTQAGIAGLRYAARKGLPVVIMEPLRGGRLASGLPKAAAEAFAQADLDRTPAEWALRWLWDLPEVTVVLSGMNDTAQIEENCRIASDAAPAALRPADMEVYRRVQEIIRAGTKVGCTGCGYCQPCPRGVDIPTCFALYNDSYSSGYWTALKEYFMCTTLRSAKSNAGRCVGCGKCERHCPQHIAIRKELANVKRRMENPAYRIGAAVSGKVGKNWR